MATDGGGVGRLGLQRNGRLGDYRAVLPGGIEGIDPDPEKRGRDQNQAPAGGLGGPTAIAHLMLGGES